MRLETASRDTLALSRRKIKGVGSYQLEALMKHLGYEVSNAHRALADCYLTWQLYPKLNEMCGWGLGKVRKYKGSFSVFPA